MNKRKILTRSSLSMTAWGNMIAVMHQAYIDDKRVPTSTAEIETWYKFLRRYPEKIIDIVICEYIATSKRPPLIADIVERSEEYISRERRGSQWLHEKFMGIRLQWPKAEDDCERIFWDICTEDEEVPDMERANWRGYQIANAAEKEIHHEGGLKAWLMMQKEQMKSGQNAP